MTDRLLRHASESRPGADGQDDYDVIGTDGLVIGRIFKANRFPNGMPWQWELAYGFHEVWIAAGEAYLFWGRVGSLPIWFYIPTELALRPIPHYIAGRGVS